MFVGVAGLLHVVPCTSCSKLAALPHLMRDALTGLRHSPEKNAVSPRLRGQLLCKANLVRVLKKEKGQQYVTVDLLSGWQDSNLGNWYKLVAY